MQHNQGTHKFATGWEFLRGVAISVCMVWERITTDLCHPFQEGLQPVDIALAVAVEECEDSGRGSIRSFHARPHQAWNDSLKHCHPKGTTNLMMLAPARTAWRALAKSKKLSRTPHSGGVCDALLNGKMWLSRLQFCVDSRLCYVRRRKSLWNINLGNSDLL